MGKIKGVLTTELQRCLVRDSLFIKRYKRGFELAVQTPHMMRSFTNKLEFAFAGKSLWCKRNNTSGNAVIKKIIPHSSSASLWLNAPTTRLIIDYLPHNSKRRCVLFDVL